MTNYDDYITGLHDSNSSMNLRENLSEIEEANVLVELLEHKLKQEKKRTEFHVGNLVRLAKLEEINSTFGSLTFEEQKEKREILEPYNQ